MGTMKQSGLWSSLGTHGPLVVMWWLCISSSGKAWKYDFLSQIWPWRPPSIALENNRDPNQGILHFWSKFVNPSLNGWLWCRQAQNGVTHEKINGHRELTVTTVVTAPGPNGHSSVTARSQLSHDEVTAQSQWSRLTHGEVTAQSRPRSRLSCGWLWPFWSSWARRELTVSSHGDQFFSHGKFWLLS